MVDILWVRIHARYPMGRYILEYQPPKRSSWDLMYRILDRSLNSLCIILFYLFYIYYRDNFSIHFIRWLYSTNYLHFLQSKLSKLFKHYKLIGSTFSLHTKFTSISFCFLQFVGFSYLRNLIISYPNFHKVIHLQRNRYKNKIKCLTFSNIQIWRKLVWISMKVQTNAKACHLQFNHFWLQSVSTI